MATPKATAMAEQAARDKQQATLDEILKSLKQIKEKLGIVDEQQLGEAPMDPTLQMRAEREVEEAKAAEETTTALNQPVKVPRPQTQTVDPKVEAERLKRQAPRFGKK